MFRHFKRGGLRTWIISLLKQSPKNGAEIMDQIETLSQGWWRPSPGSIYPLLEELTNDGSIRKREDGRYEITEKGRQEPYWTPWGNYTGMPRTIEEIIAQMESDISYLEDKVKVEKTTISNFAERLQSIKNRLEKLIQ